MRLVPLTMQTVLQSSSVTLAPVASLTLISLEELLTKAIRMVFR